MDFKAIIRLLTFVTVYSKNRSFLIYTSAQVNNIFTANFSLYIKQFLFPEVCIAHSLF